jgi:hypothetical protein
MLVNLFFLSSRSRESQCSSGVVWSKSGKGVVGGVEAGKRAKTTPDAGGKSVSESLSPCSGDVTFLLTKMILGNL